MTILSARQRRAAGASQTLLAERARAWRLFFETASGRFPQASPQVGADDRLRSPVYHSFAQWNTPNPLLGERDLIPSG
jgi:hypothetical protein